jgi:cathepsin B
MARVLVLSILSFFLFLTNSHGHVINTPQKIQGQLWTAGINKRFANMTGDELKKYVGAKLPAINPSMLRPKAKLPLRQDALPDHFNAADKWNYCANSITTIRDQAQCGSCWAVSSAAAMSDLTCIQCGGAVSPYLSDEDLLTCCDACGASCKEGSSIVNAFEYWKTYGLVTGGPYGSNSGCQPYAIQPHVRDPPTPQCYHQCLGSYPPADYYYINKHKASDYTVLYKPDPVEMQRAIYTYGPIVIGAFAVYEDFQRLYTGGIYHHTSGPFKGTHAVKVFGWGEDNGVLYWLATNSWGTDWGMNGFFKILRGQNECNFELVAAYATAASDSCFLHEPPTTTTTTQAPKPKTTTTQAPKPTTTTTQAPKPTTTTTQAPKPMTTTTQAPQPSPSSSASAFTASTPNSMTSVNSGTTIAREASSIPTSISSDSTTKKALSSTSHSLAPYHKSTEISVIIVSFAAILAWTGRFFESY